MQQTNLTVHFNRAQYRPGEPIRLSLPPEAELQAAHLFRLSEELSFIFRYSKGELVLDALSVGGYGLHLHTSLGDWEGAFDVADPRKREVRYGFLSDFSAQDADTDDVEWMRDLHLNAIQFYDWMYRHDQLLPPTEDYEDPMGRQTALGTISKKLDACRRCGIRPFAYGAVYAATETTFRAHPEWGMYTMDGRAMTFADWLYFMNIAQDCGWAEHIVDEYRKAIQFGFSGIHMDTYGFPKHVWAHDGSTVDLAQEFPHLIDRAAQAVRTEDSDGGVIFNAVNNWPVETVAKTEQDAVYIEVWPPHDSYHDLFRLIQDARRCSGKNVVLAAYLRAFQEADAPSAERSFRLAWAAICASGGTQLVLGERHALLRDSYYVKYAALRPEFLPVVQSCCDFLVRYKDLLYNDKGMDICQTAAGGINEDVLFSSEDCTFSTNGAADTVWTILRESSQRLTIHLINLRGNNAQWNEAKNEPLLTGEISVSVRLDRPIRGIFSASPDGTSLAAQALPVSAAATSEGRVYTVKVPCVRYWTAVWVELEG